jgi:RHH-type transcriptional regulator, rel operon repressor / antitoxin RelB
VKITELLLAELDREAVGIRKTLERVPERKNGERYVNRILRNVVAMERLAGGARGATQELKALCLPRRSRAESCQSVCAALFASHGVLYLYSEVVMLAIRLPQSIEKRLEKLARLTGRTKTYYVREAILEHLEEIEDLYLAEGALERIRSGEERTIPLKQVIKRHGLQR